MARRRFSNQRSTKSVCSLSLQSIRKTSVSLNEKIRTYFLPLRNMCKLSLILMYFHWHILWHFPRRLLAHIIYINHKQISSSSFPRALFFFFSLLYRRYFRVRHRIRFFFRYWRTEEKSNLVDPLGKFSYSILSMRECYVHSWLLWWTTLLVHIH